MKLDSDARYAKSHEWARKDGDEFTIGISDHAQHSLGDIVFVELPKVGASFKKGAAFGVVESVKAASDLYLPLSGKISALNTALADKPDAINKDSYGAGWIVKIVASDSGEWDALLNAADYEKIASED
ncbi:glycine cleavage system protein GcvH [Treponema sp.]